MSSRLDCLCTEKDAEENKEVEKRLVVVCSKSTLLEARAGL